jgi:hypothetical protein
LLQEREETSVQASSDIAIHTVTILDAGEVYRGQVFHDGHLWEGHSTGGVASYRLDVHSADGGQVLASARVPHTLEFLYPFGPHTILVVGKHFTDRCGWLTYHSIARFRHGRLRVKTRPLPMTLQVEQFGGRAGHMYFNETGSRKVFRWTRLGARPLAPDIYLPGVILPYEKFVFVLERNRISPGAENIVKIDLASQRIDRTFTQTRYKLSTMIDLQGFPWIAAVETWADQILLIDKESNTLAATLPAAGTPVDAVQVGGHLLVVSREPKRLRFFDLVAPGTPQVAEWDLSALGDDFANLTTMHVDPQMGNVFLRSPFHPQVAGNTPAVKMVMRLR